MPPLNKIASNRMAQAAIFGAILGGPIGFVTAAPGDRFAGLFWGSLMGAGITAGMAYRPARRATVPANSGSVTLRPNA